MLSLTSKLSNILLHSFICYILHINTVIQRTQTTFTQFKSLKYKICHYPLNTHANTVISRYTKTIHSIFLKHFYLNKAILSNILLHSLYTSIPKTNG